jgi:hypothetical protein
MHGSCRDGPTAASAHRRLLANTNLLSIAPSGVRPEQVDLAARTPGGGTTGHPRRIDLISYQKDGKYSTAIVGKVEGA